MNAAFPSGTGEPAGDLLVPPPFGGLRPLWDRLRELLRLCGRPVAWIILLTFAVPQMVQAWVVETALDGVVVAGGGLVLPAEESTADQTVNQFAIPTGGLFVWLILAYVVVAAIGALGWGAGIWAVTQAAAGLPVTVGAAMNAGARRVVSMFGWYVLYTLMVAIGLLLCLLPGVYLAVAGGLFSFVIFYERGRNPMVRSFGLVHRSFPAVLGRFALVFLFMLTAFCLVGFVVGLAGLAEPGAGAGARIAGDVLLSLTLVPIYTVVLVGLLLTYTQTRAREDEIDTARLWAAANDDLIDGVPGTDEPPGHPGPVQPG